MQQEFQEKIGQVAGKNIVNEGSHGGDSAHSINVTIHGNVTGQEIKIGTITGGTNMIGHHGDIHIHAEHVVHKPKIIIQPGPEHISDTQRAKLKELAAEVVKIESAVKRSPKSFSAVWSALNRKMKASSYHLIRSDDYPRAEKFLREWIGRLSSAKSAPAKDPDWRKRKYAYIHTNVKQLSAGERLDALLAEKHGAASLSGLSDDDLAAVYQTVSGWKRK